MYIYIYVYVCVRAFLCVYIYVYVPTHLCLYAHVCIYVCIYTYKLLRSMMPHEIMPWCMADIAVHLMRWRVWRIYLCIAFLTSWVVLQQLRPVVLLFSYTMTTDIRSWQLQSSMSHASTTSCMDLDEAGWLCIKTYTWVGPKLFGFGFVRCPTWLCII